MKEPTLIEEWKPAGTCPCCGRALETAPDYSPKLFNIKGYQPMKTRHVDTKEKDCKPEKKQVLTAYPFCLTGQVDIGKVSMRRYA